MTTTATATTATTVRLRPRPAYGASAWAILQLTVPRTFTAPVLAAMVLLLLMPMGFGVVFAAGGFLAGDPTAFLVQRYDQLVSALATPILALLLGTSAFSAEADDGTLIYLLTTPTPRWWIVTVRMLFAMTGTAVLSLLTVYGTGYLVTGLYDPLHVTRAFGVAAAFGGAAYAALFTWLALRTRRALVSGLVYIVFWEGILSSTFPALHYLSVRQWMRAVASALTLAQDQRLTDGPSLRAALIGAAIVVIGTVLLGSRALARPRLTRTAS